MGLNVEEKHGSGRWKKGSGRHSIMESCLGDAILSKYMGESRGMVTSSHEL